MKLNLPAGYDWEVWRLVGAGCMAVGLVDLEEKWSIDDVASAHTFLDIQEDLETLQANKIRGN